jgi:hypothetical protein
LQANPAVNASGEINPVPICSFGVFARAIVNAGNRASINAIGNTFAGIRDNRMGHSVLLSKIDRGSRCRLSLAYQVHLQFPCAGEAFGSEFNEGRC